MNNGKKRLLSLDLLRGFDLFCLVMLQPILITWLHIKNDPSLAPLTNQLTHSTWVGFSCWDNIMPLFMFMSGITIPFSMSRYKRDNKVDNKFYYRLAKRIFILFFLGWVIQGNLLAFDIRNFHVFANTLQSIAIGYLVVALLYVHCSFKTVIAVTSFFFCSYLIVFLTIGGMDYAPGTNIAEVIDRNVLGRFRDGVTWNGDVWSFASWYHCTWILSSLNFIVTVMLGCTAGQILRMKNKSAQWKCLFLVIMGVSLIVVGLLMSPISPIIKRIWTSSMTLFSGGICFLLMALFYYVFDIKGFSKGFGWFKYYGMNSIVAYFLSETINFQSIADSLLHGLEQFTGVFYPVVGICFKAIFVFLVVRWMYKYKIFIKA